MEAEGASAFSEELVSERCVMPSDIFDTYAPAADYRIDEGACAASFSLAEALPDPAAAAWRPPGVFVGPGPVTENTAFYSGTGRPASYADAPFAWDPGPSGFGPAMPFGNYWSPGAFPGQAFQSGFQPVWAPYSQPVARDYGNWYGQPTVAHQEFYSPPQRQPGGILAAAAASMAREGLSPGRGTTGGEWHS